MGGIASNTDMTAFITDYFLGEDEDVDENNILDESDEDYEGAFGNSE